ncbi:hypothetical protein BH24ACT5_BH24ACT5_08890 [soil metagenome]
MPWCDDCEKYWTPAAMQADGTCPTCGRPVDDGAQSAATTTYAVQAGRRSTEAWTGTDISEGDRDEGVPWHFKLMIVLLVIYLGYRFIEIGIKIFT